MSAIVGHSRGRKKGVPIYFDPDQIDAIKGWIENHPATSQPSFSEAVRTLCEWGLEAEKETEDA